MVTHDNYFVASSANFRSIPTSWTKRLLSGGEEPVVLGNQTFLRTHTSVGYYGSFSAYWESTDGSTLIRVSDHWIGFGVSRGINYCQTIRSCSWRLGGHTNVVKTLDGVRVAGGIVRFRDMRELVA